MTPIVLDHAQAAVLTAAQGDIVLKDEQGNILGYAIHAAVTADDIADCERRLATPQPCFTTDEVIAHLFAYLDDETDREKRAYIEHHLEECRACYSRAEFEKALRAKVGQLGDKEAPATLRRRVKTLLDRAEGDQ